MRESFTKNVFDVLNRWLANPATMVVSSAFQALEAHYQMNFWSGKRPQPLHTHNSLLGPTRQTEDRTHTSQTVHAKSVLLGVPYAKGSGIPNVELAEEMPSLQPRHQAAR